MNMDPLSIYKTAGYRVASSRWEGGENKYVISVGEGSARVVTDYVWNFKKRRGGINATHYLTFPNNWKRAVEKRGLAVVDGLFTLQAKKMRSVEKFDIFDALWVEQGRGLAVHVQHGYIIRDPATGEHTHHKDAQLGIISLHRRQKNLRDVLAAADMTKVTELLHHVASVVDRPEDAVANLLVSINDSYKAGNCKTGTLNWVNKHTPGVCQMRCVDLLRLAAATKDRVNYVLIACIHRARKEFTK